MAPLYFDTVCNTTSSADSDDYFSMHEINIPEYYALVAVDSLGTISCYTDVQL